MPSVKYIIELSDADSKAIRDIVSKGQAPAKTILRESILLASDKNNKKHMTVAEIADVYHTMATTVQNVRTSYANIGLEATINRKERSTPPVPAKVTGDVEAHIVALACSAPLEGYEKWSLRLLADRCVELNYAESLSHMTVARVIGESCFGNQIPWLLKRKRYYCEDRLRSKRILENQYNQVTFILKKTNCIYLVHIDLSFFEWKEKLFEPNRCKKSADNTHKCRRLEINVDLWQRIASKSSLIPTACGLFRCNCRKSRVTPRDFIFSVA